MLNDINAKMPSIATLISTRLVNCLCCTKTTFILQFCCFRTTISRLVISDSNPMQMSINLARLLVANFSRVKSGNLFNSLIGFKGLLAANVFWLHCGIIALYLKEL